MPRDIVRQLILPAITLGILIPAAVAFSYLVTRVRSPLYRTTFAVLCATFLFLLFDILRITTGIVDMDPSQALRWHRLSEVAILSLVVIAPPMFSALVELTGRVRRLASSFAIAGALFYAVTIVTAFIRPDLFVAIRVTETSYVELLGETGPLFLVGQAWMGLTFIAFFVLLLIVVVRERGRRLVGVTVGLGVSIYLALSSTSWNLFGFYIDPLPVAGVSRAGLAATVFAITSITNYVGQYVRQARELTRANTSLLRSRVELERARLRDDLTQLPNRTALLEALSATLGRDDVERAGETLAVVNVDEFHVVSDSYGHEAADRVLVQLSQRLSAVAPGTATTYRTGGDEFVICPLRFPDAASRAAGLERILEFVSQPFEVGDASIYLTVSIGTAAYPRPGDSSERIVRRAYRALADAKADRNTFRAFTPRMEEEARRTVDLVQQLRAGIRARSFSVYYQPVVNRSRTVVSAEALVRWASMAAENVGPDVFIPIAEASGLIVPMSNWIIDRVVADEREIRSTGLFPEISINISPRHLRTTDLCNELIKRLSASDAPTRRFSIELTENTLVRNIKEISESLLRLREMGFGVSMDDFGTGYSSLSYLKNLPINQVKIDRTFVVGLPDDNASCELVRTMTSLGHAFGHTIVAEGVETEEQFEFLRDTGVDYFQGYLFARGMPLPDFIGFLRPAS